MTTPAMVTNLFKTVDELDVKGFLSFLTDDATFTFANVPGVTGHDEIGAFIGGFFSSINGIHHVLHDTWEHPDTIICRGEVTYTRLDD